MVFPAVVTNETRLSRNAFSEWLGAHITSLKTQLAKEGAVLLRGFPISNVVDFDAFSKAFGYTDFTYQESLSNAIRVNHSPRVFTANEAPPEVEIFLHHEMAQTPVSPDKLFFFCQSAASEGGETPLCRSDLLYEDFKKRHPVWAAKFERLGVKYTTRMPFINDQTSGQGRSWQGTLSVNSKRQAEEKLRDLNYSWQWVDNQALAATTPVLPAVKNLPDKSQSFFNQLIAAYLGWPGVSDDPGATLRFGDNSEIPVAALQKVAELAERHTYDLGWQDGDVALVDNHRVMHGRRRYSGSRQRLVLVCLAIQ